MDKLDRMYSRKKFIKMVFPNLSEGEFYRIYQANGEFSKVEFFDDIDEMNDFCDKSRYSTNTYFNLSTTNGIGGTEEDIMTRNVLAFDFDKKDYPNGLEVKDIMFKFKELGIWYHSIISSGHGFHAYMCIEPNVDINKIIQVTKAIGNKLGADKDAMKSTQILRMPYTFNIKDIANKKHVSVIFQFKKETIKRYSLDKLYNKFCCNVKDKEKTIGTETIKYVMKNTNIPSCINDILLKGSIKGNRNADLQKIVVMLRMRNKTLGEIKHTIIEWNNINEDKFSEHELDYQTEYMFNNLKGAKYDCKECSKNSECWNNIESDFEYEESEELIIFEDKLSKQLKHSSRKGVKNMNGNELLLLNVLKNNSNGLYTGEVTKLITPRKGKSILSKPVLIKALKSLVENETIIKTKGNSRAGIQDFYEVNTINCEIEKTFNISYLATVLCINNVISTEELRLYYHMRYKHNILVKQGKAQGNIYQINQEELGKDLGITQSSISRLIKGLLESHMLDIYYKGNSKNNGFEYNVYRLNK